MEGGGADGARVEFIQNVIVLIDIWRGGVSIERLVDSENQNCSPEDMVHGVFWSGWDAGGLGY
jgi:hypothetical protein